MEIESQNKGTYTVEQKERLRKWRENNHEKFNAICRKASAVYYEKNKEAKNKANLERYHRKRAEKIRLKESEQIEAQEI